MLLFIAITAVLLLVIGVVAAGLIAWYLIQHAKRT
jgi:hypothetical protein